MNVIVVIDLKVVVVVVVVVVVAAVVVQVVVVTCRPESVYSGSWVGQCSSAAAANNFGRFGTTIFWKIPLVEFFITFFQAINTAYKIPSPEHGRQDSINAARRISGLTRPKSW